MVVGASHPDLRALIARLDAYLLACYPVEEIHGLDLEDPAMAEVTFVVAFCGGVPAGCGALRPLGTECIELKRFFVDPAFRRQGLASRILGFLEQQAWERGYRKIRLETGTRQPEAEQLYRKFGYIEIEAYGEYSNEDGLGLYFEKQLG